MNLNYLAKQCNDYAKRKGFRNESRHVGIDLMLIVSELSEALEAHRKNKTADILMFDKVLSESKNEEGFGQTEFVTAFQTCIKDSYEDEIADALIRLLEHCGELKIDIQNHFDLKMRYNEYRPYKHGKDY